MGRKLLSICLAITICVLSLALNFRTASAASTGSITRACLIGNTLYVTLEALGDGPDTPDQIGFAANFPSHGIVWGTIPHDGKFHSLTLSLVLSSAEAAAAIFVEVGDGDGNGHAIGTGFTGSFTTVPRPTCPGDVVFFDGRINNRAADSGQSVAVYCENGGITAYALYKGTGAFKISYAALAKFP